MAQTLLVGLVALTVVLNTLAQTLLKLGSGSTPFNWYLLGGLGAYGFSTIFYILVLGRFNLSIIYPIVIGLTIVATTMAGALYLSESVPLSHWVGIGLMLSGIGAIAFGGKLLG